MSKKLVADIIIETLAAAGAKRCYGIAGDTLNYVTDAIRRSDIRCGFMCATKRWAGFARWCRSIADRRADTLRRLLWTGRFALHQRTLRESSQSRPGGVDCKPDPK